jgi:cytochrome c-type biogenesis protein CcmH
VTEAVISTVPSAYGRALKRWLIWAVLLVALVVSLAIGAQRSNHPSLDQRTLQIAGMVRCPVCQGQSAAQSDAPPSLEIRTLIRQKLQAGEKQSQIIAELVDSYGTSILEKPQASGVSLLVWLLPVSIFLLALVGLGVAFSRWRRRVAVAVTTDDRALVERALTEGAGPVDDGGDPTK